MENKRLMRLLLLPSLLSGTVVSLLSVAYLAYMGWQYIQDNRYFYDLLFGSDGAQTYAWSQSFDTPPWLAHFFSGSLVYFMLLITLACVLGAIVYGILQFVTHVRADKAALSQAMVAAGTRRSLFIDEVVTRIALRVMVVLGWGLYSLFFTSVVIEVTTLGLHHSIDSVQAGRTGAGSIQLLATMLLLVAATHVHVYFLRLLVMRPRVTR